MIRPVTSAGSLSRLGFRDTDVALAALTRLKLSATRESRPIAGWQHMKIMRSSSSLSCVSKSRSSLDPRALVSSATSAPVFCSRNLLRRMASMAALCATRNSHPAALSGTP